MMAPATLVDEPYWVARHNAGDRSMALGLFRLREIDQAKEAEGVDRMIHDWLGELAASDHTPELNRVDRAATELDRAWKGAN
ncbi:hypothetical protein [Devosia salina]|uniref:Uncharacterized protein n=1 Tax=Devosia salina TaxID=2860336 RepID=A0ABX8WN14_9HYPH|nr:hypothetical protein [Devosia salina]QYO78396.1 hypothetical protein K1X15_07575 [Devosia salina]